MNSQVGTLFRSTTTRILLFNSKLGDSPLPLEGCLSVRVCYHHALRPCMFAKLDFLEYENLVLSWARRDMEKMEDRALEITQKNPPELPSPDSSPFPSQQQPSQVVSSQLLPSDSQPTQIFPKMKGKNWKRLPTTFVWTISKDEGEEEEDEERSLQSHDPGELCCIEGCHRVHSNHTYAELAGTLRTGQNSMK